MASAQAKNAEQVDEVESSASDAQAPRAKRKKFLLIGVVAAFLLIGAGVAWTTGVLRNLIGGGSQQIAPTAEAGRLDLPDIVANLNTGSRRTSFVRLRARLELTSKLDEAAVAAATPRLLDLFQTYLRDMRPEELRGSAGTYRLREELMARANIVIAPAKVMEILFVELLVQ